MTYTYMDTCTLHGMGGGRGEGEGDEVDMEIPNTLVILLL